MRAGGLGDYLLGAAFLLAVLGSCTAVAHLLVARRLGHLRGLLRGLAMFLVATASLWAMHLVPALLGVLSIWTVGVCAALALVAARAVPAATHGVAPTERHGEPDPDISRWLAAAGILVTTTVFLAYLMTRSPVTMSVDAVSNHLPHVAHWIQTGSLWQLTAFVPDLSHATYPQSGNVLLLAVTLPWKSTFLTSYVSVLFLAVSGLAVHALARELGAPRSSSALAATAVVTLPVVAVTALQEIMVDPQMLAWGTVGAVFLLRAARSRDVAELVLAGCGLGLAFGTKWYAVPYVPVLWVAWLIAVRRTPGALRDSMTLAGTIALFGGVWLVRNWVLTGDPVHPARVAVLGVELFAAPHDVARERYGFKVSDYLFDAAVWRGFFLPGFSQAFGLLGGLLVLGSVAAVAGRRRTRAVGAIGACSVAIAFLYVFVVPDTAFGPRGVPFLMLPNSRYLVPAFIGAAVLTAWLVGRAGRARQPLEALLLLCVLSAAPRWALEAASAPDLVVAAVIVGGLAAAAHRRPRLASLERPHAGTLAAAGVVVLAAGWFVWRGDWWSTYAGTSPAIALTQRVAPSDSRVAIAGEAAGFVSPVLPAYGRRLDNRVEYVGRFEDGILRKAGREAFLRQLRTVRYDVVIAGTGIPVRPAGDQPEVEWAIEAGYRVRARSKHLVALTPR